MQVVNIKKGYRLNLAGCPGDELEERQPQTHVGLSARGLPFLKARLTVKVGDQVKIGDLLFTDKNNASIKFLSPAGGEITAINYGPKRVLEEIVIKLAEHEDAVTFPAFKAALLPDLPRETLQTNLIDGGLWRLIRELPFRKAADPASNPSRIFVQLDSLDPCRPDPKVYLKGNDDLFAYGLKVLEKLAGKTPTLIIAADNAELAEKLKDYELLGFKGQYPAHDPGVLLYHTKKTKDENHAWYIDGQDVLALAELLQFGRYPTRRIYAVGGVSVKRRHVLSRVGAGVRDITGFDGAKCLRILANSVFNGYLAMPDYYAGLNDKSYFVILSGDRKGRCLAWMLPGITTSSSFRAFLSSWFKRPDRGLNTSMHGEIRSCISCNQCVRLCPVDIMPNLAWKALLADEIEEALAHGLLDCVECGLCSYGCPSKIELSEVLREAKAAFYKELQA